jgi:DNA repair exonuclease SbcCD ATPase subunit
VQLGEGQALGEEAHAALAAEQRRARTALKAEHRKAVSELRQLLAEAQAKAEAAHSQWTSAAKQLGHAQKTAGEKSGRVRLQEAELAELRHVASNLKLAHQHIAARDARICELLAREQLPANSSRVPTRSDACPVCNRPPGLVVQPHEPGRKCEVA